MRRLLLVEDNAEFNEILHDWAEEVCPGVQVDDLWTEVEFLKWIAEPSAPLPDLVLLDIKIPATSPSPSMERLEVPDTNGGLRCLQRLKDSARHAAIPAFLISSTPLEGEECISKKDGEILRALIRDTLCR
jgi:CheY-like chemotaxis protein